MTQDAAPELTDADWRAGIALEQRREGRLSLFVLLALVGYFLLQPDGLSTFGRVALPIGAAAVALFMAYRAGLIGNGLERGRADDFRVQHAVRRHIDPGPEWQERADACAERTVFGAVASWTALPVVVVRLLQAPWEHLAVSVAGSLLLVVGLTGSLAWQRELAAASRRWLADAPGRAAVTPYEPPDDQRPWTIAARQGRVLALLVLVTVAALVIAVQTLA